MNIIKEAIKYFGGSVVAFLLDIGLLYILVNFMGLHYLVSVAISFSAGVIVLYLLSIYWIFSERKKTNWSEEFLIFFLVGLVGLGINLSLVWLLVEWLAAHYLLAKLLASGFTVVFNFVFRRILLFIKDASKEGQTCE